jgi:23S rRNA (adenine2503-C2)-methyltransferase
MRDLKDLTMKELEAGMAEIGEPAYRAGQIFAWIYRRGAQSIEEFTDLSKSLREKLAGRYSLGTLGLEERRQSADGTEKFLFKLEDGRFIECVLIPSGERNTVCLSTQVGCKFGCAFCASGLDGFKRDLRSSEILGQVLFLRDRLNMHLTNFVFMGMGEPLDNFENTARAILIMNSPKGLGIAARRMTVSTVGIVPGIESLRNMGLQVNLSLSLHAVRDDLRSKLVPINKKYPLEEVIKACQDYTRVSGRMMTLEYILIQNVNDGPADAAGLARIAARLKAKINLIPYSPDCGLGFEPPSKNRAAQFQEWLEEKGANATLRQSKGLDIRAACGQLAGRK